MLTLPKGLAYTGNIDWEIYGYYSIYLLVGISVNLYATVGNRLFYTLVRETKNCRENVVLGKRQSALLSSALAKEDLYFRQIISNDHQRTKMH